MDSKIFIHNILYKKKQFILDKLVLSNMLYQFLFQTTFYLDIYVDKTPVNKKITTKKKKNTPYYSGVFFINFG